VRRWCWGQLGAAGGLDSIHAAVTGIDQVIGIVGVLGEDGQSHAGSDPQRPPVREGHVEVEALVKAVGQGYQSLARCQSRHHDGELVASHATCHLVAAGGFLEAGCHSLE